MNLSDSLVTPLDADAFEEELGEHPNRSFVSYVVLGIREGFDVGFTGPQQCTFSDNLKSSINHPQVVEKYLEEELKASRISGPFDSHPFPFFRCSPLGVVPKKKPNEFRLIMDQSSPRGASINDFIPKENFSLSYITVDDAIHHILELGKGTQLTKIDVLAAFRCVPVKPYQWNLMGFTWNKKFYYDKVLSMGGRSSPYIFNAIAEAAEYICKHNFSINIIIHLLDDFLAIDKPGVVSESLDIILQVFKKLGIPVNKKKIEGPTTCLEFLGITLDTEKFEARLSEEKRLTLIDKLISFQTKKKASKREVLSLIGSLSFACKVVSPGRSFLSRLIKRAYSVTELHYFIRISDSLLQECSMWLYFLRAWNGKSFFLSRTPEVYDETFSTDAAGTLGYGGLLRNGNGTSMWFSEAWNKRQLSSWHIGPKELYPIVIAASLWGNLWAGKRVVASCDNASVVAAINKGYSNHVVLSRMLRALTYYCMKFNFSLRAQHIAGKLNTDSDSLSRLQVQKFLTAHPEAAGLRTHTTEDQLAFSQEV